MAPEKLLGKFLTLASFSVIETLFFF